MPIAKIAVIAAILISLTACGGGSSHRPQPGAVVDRTKSAVAASSPRETPAPRAPVLDPDAHRHANVGALTVGLYLYQALAWADASNDPAILVPLSGPRCQTCRRWINGLRDLRRTHKQLVGGRIVIRTYSLEPNTYRERGDYVLHVTVDQSPLFLRSTSGLRRISGRLRGFRALVFLAWHRRRWVVVEVFRDGKS